MAQDVNAVQDVTLSIPSNSIYGIIGKSGAGKSTLVRLISLLEKPDSGCVLYNNERVDNLSSKELIQRRRHIGMIFQSFNLFSSRTAAKNIAYPLEICGTPQIVIKQRVAELLELVGLADRADSPVSQLSGGQKQRIAIARALANNPDILFCDEATSALDPQTTRAILSLIREIQQKMNLTVVMITHQMEVARDACDYVAVLDGGKVVEQGTVTEIFTKPQSEVTKDFLANLKPPTEDENLSSQKDVKLVRWSQTRGKYLLRFVGALTDEPVLSNMLKKIDVEVNIRAGGIQHLSTGNVGTLAADITGSPENVAAAINYLGSMGITVEE
ncbi:MAG: methionine ABC transporter ATP-binding protein [Spirochaetaceae bacterium]|nr:methionine ABC transporter ATP-binding protein [Spirochaetaceae bacterium]